MQGALKGRAPGQRKTRKLDIEPDGNTYLPGGRTDAPGGNATAGANAGIGGPNCSIVCNLLKINRLQHKYTILQQPRIWRGR